jgi:MFS family permease
MDTSMPGWRSPGADRAHTGGAVREDEHVRPPSLRPTAAAVAVTTASMLPVYLVGGLAVQIRAELGFARSTVGLLVAAFFAAAAAGSFLAGRSADRLGAERMMRASAVLAAASLLGAALAPGAGWLAGALLLGGLSSGAGQPASNALISRAVAAHRRGFAYGAKQAAIPISVLLAGLSVPAFGITVGWRWAFATAGLLVLAVAAGVPRRSALPAGPGPRQVGAARAETAIARSRAAAGPYLLAPLTVLALGTTLGAAVGNAFGAFYVETAVAGGIAPGVAGLYAAAGSIVGVTTRLAIGALADRRTAPYLMVVAVMMSAGAAAAGLLATGATAAMLPAVVLAYGVGWAWAGLLTFAVVLTHPDHPGRATGITQGGAAIGGTLGPLGFGQLAEHASLAAAWAGTAACALLATVAILTGRAMLLHHRPELVAALRAGRAAGNARGSRRSGVRT